ncbi:DUF5906 domain-containing protein [Synechococcus sp. UW105]|uniref:DUF5906 domain-containing protein n=1 Tax=Synechococcus sp. UW105 TaxID=337067 RepID=UPI000E0ED501|nr:DUF5906 domain-containing protein [Synechococcus sp. UW105]
MTSIPSISEINLELDEARALTEEDLTRYFTAQVEQALLHAPDPDSPPPAPLITVNGQTYQWAANYYRLISTSKLKRKIVEIARVTKVPLKDGGESHPFMKPRFITEALQWIQLRTERDAEELNPDGYVNCRNGVLHISWDGSRPIPTLEIHDPEQHLFTDPPGVTYNAEADLTYANQLLECFSVEGRALFLEVAGATLDVDAVRSRGHRIPATMLIGTGKNGKDTIREALGRLHGSSSVAILSIKDWQGYESGSGRGRFSVSQLDRARLSIGSENSGAFKIDNLESLKAAITGEPMYVEDKGIKGNWITPRAAFLFFLNQPPLLDGGSAAIASRWGVIKMPHTYSVQPKPGQKTADPRFKHDPDFLAEKVLPGLLNLLIQTLGDVVQHGFSLDAVSDDLQELREATCHIHGFLRDAGYRVTNDITDEVEAKDIWEDLTRWYKDNDWMAMDRIGDWKFISTKDGDEPIRAARLLPKRLMQLYPDIKPDRATTSDRRVLVYGIKRVGANTTDLGANECPF